MNAKDQSKIIQSGLFTIIRADYERMKIKARTMDRPKWHNYEGTGANTFSTKTGLRKRMDFHLTKPYYVED